MLAYIISRMFSVECEAVKFEAEKSEKYLRKIGRHDVVISALPARYNFEIARSALNLGINFCDLGGVLSVTKEIRSLNGPAYRQKVALVPDCGLMPGFGVMLAKQLVLKSIEREPEADLREVVIYVGGLPQKPVPPLYYQRVFSLEGLRHLCYDEPFILVNGKVEAVRPLSGYEKLRVDELVPFSKKFNGCIEAFITAGAALAPWDFRALGVTYLCEKTVRWPNFVKGVSGVEEKDFENKIGPLVSIPVDKEHPDLVWMRVEVSYKKGTDIAKKLTSSMLVTYDPEVGLSAMAQTTGFPTALVARHLAQGPCRTGAYTPDGIDQKNLNKLIAETGAYFKIEEKETP